MVLSFDAFVGLCIYLFFMALIVLAKKQGK